MSELERLQAELAALQAHGEALEAQREPGTDLIRADAPEAVQARMQEVHEQLRRHHVLVRAKAAEIRAHVEQQREALEQMARDAERALEPVKAAMREVGEQIKTIELYLGTGEKITQLRDGEAASVGTTVTVRQMILRMDEEVAAAAEEGGLDYRNMAEFDAWLLESPEHLRQVLPEPKGVVCFTPRDPARSKEDTRKASIGENPDATMYWLIRNGERLYRMTTDFKVADKLVPGPTTLTDLFTDRDGKPIRPGSMDWDRAQEAANEAERAYFRVQVILEGLLHRTPVFEPLPVQGMSFMDEAHHEAGRLAFILDAEASLSDGTYESFPAWQRRLNAQLRPGLRIVGFFDGRYSGSGFGGEEYESSRWGPHGNRRLHPSQASYPASGVIYELERVQGKKLGFKYERTDTVYRDWSRRSWRDENWESHGNARVRASCVVEPGDDWIIPYDLATEEELRSFLHRRTERKHYVQMFPVIKAALRAKREEREAEEPFRVMLAGVLARENGVSVEAAREAIPELVDWFKLTNKWHRPLLHKVQETGKGSDGLPEDRAQEMAAKAVRLITAEHARRVRIERSKPDVGLVEALRGGEWKGRVRLFNDAVMVGRRRSDGKYIVVVPERSDENVYASLIVWGKRKGLDELSRWQIVTKRMAASWQVLWMHERWGEWELDADPRKHLTDGELEHLMGQMRQAFERGDDCPAGAPVLGFTLERRYGVDELVGYVLTAEPVMPDPERLLSEPGSGGSVEMRSRGWVRTEEGVRWAREEFTTGWRHGGSAWNSGREWLGDKKRNLVDDPWGKDARVLWRDRGLIERLRPRFVCYARLAQQRQALGERVYVLRRAIGRAWLAAWWEEQRQAFVAEYGKPELWDGQRKIIEDRQRRSYKTLSAPLDGLRELLEPFVERGLEDRVWGRTVADVLNEAVGRGWAELEPEEPLDASLLPLRFEVEQPEPEVEASDEEPPVEFDAEGSIEAAGELPEAIEDAEVVE